MAKNIRPQDLKLVLDTELSIYRADIVEKINLCGKAAIESLVSLTRLTAPMQTGKYSKNITYKRKRRSFGDLFIWYVKKPFHRLTHLLVHGHATENGGRTDADPFLEKALANTLEMYQEAILAVIHGDRGNS